MMAKIPGVDQVPIVKRTPKDAMLACARWTALQPLMLPDNVTGQCAECGHSIQFRPHASKKIRKVCTVCVADAMDAGDKPTFLTTQRMADDFITFVKKQKQ